MAAKKSAAILRQGSNITTNAGEININGNNGKVVINIINTGKDPVDISPNKPDETKEPKGRNLIDIILLLTAIIEFLRSLN